VYYYSISIWARSAAPGTLTLLRDEERSVRTLGPTWQRLVFSSGLGSDDIVKFGVEVPAMASLELFGAQVEAQVGASNYKKTTSRGGVYPETRFSEDGFSLSTAGPGRHGCQVRLVSQ
jgi:hypothetical protein